MVLAEDVVEEKVVVDLEAVLAEVASAVLAVEALVAQEEAAPEVKVVTPDQLDEDIDHAVSEDVTTDE